jgi:hypothetical protein
MKCSKTKGESLGSGRKRIEVGECGSVHRIRPLFIFSCDGKPVRAAIGVRTPCATYPDPDRWARDPLPSQGGLTTR